MSPLNSPWQGNGDLVEVVRLINSISIVFTDHAGPARIGQVQTTIQIDSYSLAVTKFDFQAIPRKD